MRASLGLAALLAALPCAAQQPPRNPQIEAIVAAIQPARIEARIRKLASLHTRHTLSRTDSDTQGIGAARRWIKSELDACGKAAGGRLKVELDSFIQQPARRVPKPVEIVNVVATLPGTQAPNRIYAVSGHYDSIPGGDYMDAEAQAPGANDDASGTAVSMELACVMASHRFDATLVFMAVAGEEQGLLGSGHWAEEAKKKGSNIAGMITNDIVGSSTGADGSRHERRLRLFASGLPYVINARGSDLAQIARSGGENDTPTHQLGRHLKEMGERYVPGFTVELIPRPDRFLRGGDHLPFLERGYAAVRFTEPSEDYRHQHQNVRVENGVQIGDLPAFVDFAYVANVARVNAAALASLALAPASPRDAGIEVVQLENDTTLRWSANDEPGLAGYRIVWREVGAPLWQHSRDAGNVTRFTLNGISKDNFVFGVVALDRDGNASPASFPAPWRPGSSAIAPREERAIRKEALVRAPVADVWNAWTTSAGIQSFFAPEAIVDPRPEGAFRLHFNPYAPPGAKGADDMRFLGLQREKMLSFTWNAPPHLPDARLQRTMVIVRMEPAGDKETRVRLTHIGWGEGGEWDKAYEYFDRAWGNVLANLQKRFTDGPIDWKPFLDSLKGAKK
jgi:uncharacterized protein YndB with AHSA1/START domain